MAEPFGIAASAIQVAGAGLSLAKTLHAYIGAVKSAQKHVKAVAVEVKLTASVLEHLRALLKENEAEKLCTPNVLSDAQDALSGCKEAFGEIDEAFNGVVRSLPDGTRSISATARFAWPFKKGKLEALQANLERLKSTLLLMLSVLSYAREKVSKPADVLSVQRLQIRNLIKTKDDATLRYEEMLVNLSRLETSDVYPEALHHNVQDDFPPQIAMSATDMRPPATQGDPQDSTAFLRRLGGCASAVSNLAASISHCMANYSTESELAKSLIRCSFDGTEEGVNRLLTFSPPISRDLNPPMSLTNRPLAPPGEPASDQSPSKDPTRTQPVLSWEDRFARWCLQQVENGNLHPQQDYSFHLMMLERQNQRRLLMARGKQDAPGALPADNDVRFQQQIRAQQQATTQAQIVAEHESAGSDQSSQREDEQPPTTLSGPPQRKRRVGQIDGLLDRRSSSGGKGVVQRKRTFPEGRFDQEYTGHKQVQKRRHAEQPLDMNAPFGSPDNNHHFFPDMIDFASESADELDNFDFDSFLNNDGEGGFELNDENHAFGDGMLDDVALDASAVFKDEEQSQSSAAEEVDEVDELITKWTTVEA